ncbi:MAG: hypothetical protein LBE13_05550 [Bacteroidales bacterium]|jgi:hypothetical protein|nr:hypothetical protein [Bacteroidales bacterium]
MRKIFEKLVNDTELAVFFKNRDQYLIKVLCQILQLLCWIISLIPLALGLLVCRLLFEDHVRPTLTVSSVVTIFLLFHLTRPFNQRAKNLCDNICDKLENRLDKD